jgi:hypothetical protein
MAGGRPIAICASSAAKTAAAVNGEVLQIAINGQRSGIAVTRDYLYLPPQYFQRPTPGPGFRSYWP